MKLTKVAFAVASVLAIAGGAAQAGQIDSSSATLAREVIYSATQVVRAPSKSYAFVGTIDARTNEQRLQLQWTLDKGMVWSRTGDVPLTSAGVTNLPLANKVLNLNGKNLANAAIGFDGALIGGLTGVTVDAFLANADSTLVFNITIPADPANYISNGVFQINSLDFNAGGAATGQNIGVTNVLAVALATTCVGPDTNANIDFKHYTNHNGNTSLQSGLNPDSEHVRNGSNNSGRFLNFTENLKFTFANGTQSQTDAASLRKSFLTTVARTADYATAAVTLATASTNLHRISSNIDLSKVASGLDLDYTSQYGNGATNAVPFEAIDFSVASPATLNNGIIEGTTVITVTSPLGAAGVSAGSTVGLLTATDGVIAGAVVTPFDANGVATITLPSAAAQALLATGAGARLYYIVSGADEIPQNAVFNVSAQLKKATAGALREQNNTCAADQAGVGGGIKIDVRNYASYASFGPTGPATTVRLINNSESQSADIYAQMIYADGTYGPWGQLPTLKPREVANWSNQTIEGLLTNASTVTNPFGTGTVYTRTAGAAVVAGPKAGISDRLRIVSNTGSTLRVQSYMIVGNSVIDTSNAQGVDFENSGSRVPTTAVDAQPVSQDAINGLAK